MPATSFCMVPSSLGRKRGVGFRIDRAQNARTGPARRNAAGGQGIGPRTSGRAAGPSIWGANQEKRALSTAQGEDAAGAGSRRGEKRRGMIRGGRRSDPDRRRGVSGNDRGEGTGLATAAGAGRGGGRMRPFAVLGLAVLDVVLFGRRIVDRARYHQGLEGGQDGLLQWGGDQHDQDPAEQARQQGPPPRGPAPFGGPVASTPATGPV